jgi:REP element-mobilizing transposase RayT
VQVDRGIQRPNVALARFYDRQAKHDVVSFSARHQGIILWICWDACKKRSWKLHGVAFDPSHVHLLVSWRSPNSWQVVRGKLKNLISWALSKEKYEQGRKWMVRYGSRKRVKDRRHYDYLMNCYLPKHRGIVWKDGDVVPEAPEWAVN